MSRGAILMVIILIAVPFSGCLSDDDDNTDTYRSISISDVRIEEGERYSGTWTLSVEISRVKHGDQGWSWDEFTVWFDVEGTSGVLEKIEKLEAWTGDLENEVEGWYVKKGSDPSKVEKGDIIRVTGVRDWESGISTVSFELRNETQERVFDSSRIGPFFLRLDTVSIKRMEGADPTMWEVMLMICATKPRNLQAFINDHDIRIEKGGWRVVEPDIDLEAYNDFYYVVPTALYRRNDHTSTFVTVGDEVRVTTLDEDFAGGWISLTWDSAVVGTLQLPETLP